LQGSHNGIISWRQEAGSRLACLLGTRNTQIIL
jgi:predicted hotdog family 3-hydroxylacyl-ACP dehydratase